MRMLTLFDLETTFARIDFLRQGGWLMDKKALIVLNFLLKSGQKRTVDELTSGRGDKLRSE